MTTWLRLHRVQNHIQHVAKGEYEHTANQI
jgi:hypothetical protein